eukprot:10962682-Ditylum_brightwellii.AAC.1
MGHGHFGLQQFHQHYATQVEISINLLEDGYICIENGWHTTTQKRSCLLYTSPSPRDPKTS